jgi:hypothetical protein
MTLTPIALLEQAADYNLKLGFEEPNTLTVEPARLCSSEFATVLKAHKPRLLALLRLSFCMAYSKTLEETIFLCEDDDTREALIEAGAESGSIYTLAELQVLVAHHRAKPFLPDELCKLHEIKRTFNRRIATSC